MDLLDSKPVFEMEFLPFEPHPSTSTFSRRSVNHFFLKKFLLKLELQVWNHQNISEPKKVTKKYLICQRVEKSLNCLFPCIYSENLKLVKC